MLHVTTKNVESAKEFWDLLSPEKTLVSNVAHDKFLYRGQRDENWHLTPSLYRVENLTKAKPAIIPNLTVDELIFFEWRRIDAFIKYCDETGLPIPNDSPELRGSFEQNGRNEWTASLRDPNKRLSGSAYAIIALAQHYGLPTRLLDWSRRGYVAAYFAASDAMREALNKKERSGISRLAVWIFNTSKLFRLEALEHIGVSPVCNSNLVAQSGRFLALYPWVEQSNQPVSEDHFRIDQYVESRKVDECLWKITLPIREAPCILKLCNLYGISAATLFPDYYGAVRHTEDDQACWAFKECE